MCGLVGRTKELTQPVSTISAPYGVRRLWPSVALLYLEIAQLFLQ